jgi:DNA helicase-4
MAQYITTPSWLGRFFTRIKHVSIEQNSVVVYFRNNTTQPFLISDFTHFSQLKNRIFSAKLNLSYGRDTSISFLNKKQAKVLNNAINERVAYRIEQKINNAKALLKRYALDEFVRDSTIEILAHNVFALGKSYLLEPVLWQLYLLPTSIKFLKIVSSTPSTHDAVAQLRKKYERKQLTLRDDFYNNVESHPLTLEQRLAVIRDNDKNLVLAAAGTGKTSVMIAKSLDLIARGLAKPEKILLLAYNKTAAQELKQRFVKCAKHAKLASRPPIILTFHALGLKLLQNAKKPTHLSTFTTDPLQLNNWLINWVSEQAKKKTPFLKTFIDLLHEPIDMVSFNSTAHYERYVRDNQYHSLAGHKVTSYQALLISNWLYLHGIEYQYAPSYRAKQHDSDTVKALDKPYHPDFYLSEYNLYIDYFAIDRQGNTRTGIDKNHYNDQIAFKRELHKINGTVLLETFYYNWLEGTLAQRLAKQLKQRGVVQNPLSDDDILAVLNSSGQLQRGVEKYLKCLQAIRVEPLSNTQIAQRIEQSGIKNYQLYAKLLTDIHNAYLGELKAQHAIDFDDMIIKATAALNNHDVSAPWSYILVDEFQDISGSRIVFLNALIEHGDDTRLTAVGDDWQAIYRFSGGKLALTTRFSELVGSHSLTMLQKSFRYNNSISDVAGRFVMQNPEQYKKHITTHTQLNTEQVILLDDLYQGSKSVELKTRQTITTIQKNHPNASIAVLSRYKYLLNNVHQHVKSKGHTANNLYFWTLHSAKGLEADYCIIIGFEHGKLGFPSDNQNNVLVESLLPTEDSFAYSEERRLLYVGLTRAKHKVYLIANPYACSVFIKELINNDYPIHSASRLLNKSQLKQR